jgi:predicted dienelactone hydrolase
MICARCSNLFVILLATSLFARADEPKPYSPPAPAATVADIKLEWHDVARNRDVPAKIYFPKEGAGPFPIIIFSHGLGGSRDGYEYLGKHWAGCGYVSVHLQHLGSDDSIWKDVPAADRTRSVQKAAMNISNALNRPPDVQFAIDQVEKLNADGTAPLKGRLDLKSIAVAGHSFGGYTTLAIAGQTFMLPLNATKRYDEPRIKAAIQMSAPAPALRRDLDTAYGSITIPVMHMTGTKDFLEILPQTTAADRRIPFDHMSHAETCLVIFNDGDHMIFSGRGRVGAPEKLAQDEAFQKLICAGTTAFWDAYLKGSNAAKHWLLDGDYAKLLGAQATFEKKQPKK